MKVLELFSGTHSVGKVCKELGWEVTSLDLSGADINMSIMDWDYKSIPRRTYDVIWASPPCTYFSTLQYCHRTKEEIQELINEQGLPLLRKTEEIIQYFQPDFYFIENPFMGSMKKYVDRPYHVVDYCRYSDWGYKKPTIIWTNNEWFKPKRCNCARDGKKHVHCLGQKKTDKYRIPSQLIRDLFEGLVMV